jgi:hypothetical protein
MILSAFAWNRKCPTNVADYLKRLDDKTSIHIYRDYKYGSINIRPQHCTLSFPDHVSLPRGVRFPI